MTGVGRVAAAMGLGLGLVACGTTGPTGPTTGALALHYDSLAARASAAGDGMRADYLREITVGLARGVRPMPVAITADGVSRRFQALAYEGVVGPGDSEFVAIAWDGWEPSAFVLATVTVRGPASVAGGSVTYTPDGASLLVSDSGAISVARVDLGSGCPFTPLRANPFGSGVGCARQATSWSFTVRVRPRTSGEAPVLLDLPVQSVPGVRLDLGAVGGAATAGGLRIAER